MGKLRVFEVNFDDNGDLYKPGDWIQGSVKIVLSEPKSDIRGKCKNKWTESESNGKTSHAVRYWWKEKLFEEKVLILGKEKKDSSGEKVELSAGEHNFPFKFQIPNKPLPHALEGKYGYIRYKVKGKIDRPWRFDHKTEKLFSVVGSAIDLNNIPGVELPSTNADEKTVCCLCCASGPVKGTAEIDKTGYVPGESVWVSGMVMMVENNSTRTIVDITARLVQSVTFRAKRCGSGWEHKRTQKTTLAEHKGVGCEGHRTVPFDRTSLFIPSCPPSKLVGCAKTEIEHYIEFEADVKHTPFDLTVKLPVTIGTVPLKSAYSNIRPTGVITQQPTAPSDEYPPPSYEVAMGGPQEIPREDGYDYTFGKLMFAPKYPYYAFPSDPTLPPSSQNLYPSV